MGSSSNEIYEFKDITDILYSTDLLSSKRTDSMNNTNNMNSTNDTYADSKDNINTTRSCFKIPSISSIKEFCMDSLAFLIPVVTVVTCAVIILIIVI